MRPILPRDGSKHYELAHKPLSVAGLLLRWPNDGFAPASRISRRHGSPVLREMRADRPIPKTEIDCSVWWRYSAARFTGGNRAVRASRANARRLHGALRRSSAWAVMRLSSESD